MLPSFFTFTRYESDRTPGQAMLWWALSRGQLDHAIIRVTDSALAASGGWLGTFSGAGMSDDALVLGGVTADRLES